MSDIVERLRADGAWFRGENDVAGPHVKLLVEEAADEIERLRADYNTARDAHDRRAAEVIELRAALREIADFDTDEDISNEECMRDIARAALGGKDGQ